MAAAEKKKQKKKNSLSKYIWKKVPRGGDGVDGLGEKKKKKRRKIVKRFREEKKPVQKQR